MDESETIVADPTCRLGNHLHVSSGDNALASASWGPAEGLASHQAITLRNHCSAVMPATRTGFKWKVRCRACTREAKATPPSKSDRCTWRDLRRMGDGMMARTGMQSREGPCPISATDGMRNANIGCVWGHGLSHEAIVAMTPMITSGRSEGPLGYRGHGGCGVPERLPERASTLLEAEPHHYGEARIKPQEKGASDGRTRSLEPDWGNLTVRDFRGVGRNLTVGWTASS
jgi:hypothetical protein